MHSAEMVEVLGDNEVEKDIKVIDNVKQSVSEIQLEGVFIAIGHEPNTKLFVDQLEMVDGYIVVNKGSSHFQTQTSTIPVPILSGHHYLMAE